MSTSVRKDGQQIVYFRNNCSNGVTQVCCEAAKLQRRTTVPVTRGLEKRQINHLGKAMCQRYREAVPFLPETVESKPLRALTVEEVEVGAFEVQWRLLPKSAIVASPTYSRLAYFEVKHQDKDPRYITQLYEQLQKVGLLLIPIFAGSSTRRRRNSRTRRRSSRTRRRKQKDEEGREEGRRRQ